MPELKIPIGEKHLARLQELAARYNANAGTNLTVTAWVVTILQDTAIREALSAAHPAIKNQSEANANAAFNGALQQKRTELLDELKKS